MSDSTVEAKPTGKAPFARAAVILLGVIGGIQVTDPGGVIADRYGRRHVLMVALLVGAVGQLITAFAPATGLYLLGRVIAGMAMGVLFGASYALLREVASKALGPAMGLYNVANVVVACQPEVLAANPDWVCRIRCLCDS